MELEENQVYCMDAREGFKLLKDKSVTLIITDPDYSDSYSYNILAFESYRILKPWGSLVFETGSLNLPMIFNRFKKSPLFYRYLLSVYCPVNRLDSTIKTNDCIFPFLWFVKDRGYHFKPAFVEVSPVVVSESSNTYFKPNGHKWEKSIDFYESFIFQLTHENDLVVDPFCGSGTCLLACKKLNRRYIGFDIDSKSVEISKKRLK